MCPLDRAYLCTVLPSSGITRYLRYYYGIRLPRRLLAPSVCSIVGYTLPCVRERRGYPELLSTHCTPCLALRPRNGIRSLALTLTDVLLSVSLTTSARPFLNFAAQSLSGLVPNCQRLNTPIAACAPWLATGGVAAPCRAGFSPANVDNLCSVALRI